MESQYKRDINQEYFRSLNSYNYSPVYHAPNPGQINLIEKIHRDYEIASGNINRLIQYTELALTYALESELKYYDSDGAEVDKFEKEPFPIKEIVFSGWQKGTNFQKSLKITNPYLINKLYAALIEYMNYKNNTKGSNTTKKKKRISTTLIKKVATEIFNELTQVNKITEWQSLCIIGYIYSYYCIGLKTEEPILIEEEYDLMVEEKEKKGQIVTESYLQYLAARIKRYIIK